MILEKNLNQLQNLHNERDTTGTETQNENLSTSPQSMNNYA